MATVQLGRLLGLNRREQYQTKNKFSKGDIYCQTAINNDDGICSGSSLFA